MSSSTSILLRWPASLVASLALLGACTDDGSADTSETGTETSGDGDGDGDPSGDGDGDPTGDGDGDGDPTGDGDGDPTGDGDGDPAAPLSLKILHINDHHSHLQPDDFDFDVSGLELDATADTNDTPLAEVQVTYGGMPMLTALFDQLDTGEDTLRIHAGDAITGTLYYSLFKGEADARMMNEICFDAFALGNHEFDDGDQGLADFLDFLAEGECETPVLAANVSPGPDSALAEGYLLPYTIAEVSGQEVGLIGIDIASKTSMSSQPDEGTEFLDELTTAQQYIDELTGMGVDKIVLVTHYQYQQDLELAAGLSGVDVIVGGDSHTLLGGPNLTELGFQVGGDYPSEVTNLDGTPVCVVQAWEYAHLLGELQVEFDEAGVVTSCEGSPRMPIEGASFVYEFTNDMDEDEELELQGEDVATVLAALGAYEEIVVIDPDADALTTLASFDDDISELVNTVIASVPETLCLERFPGQGQSGDVSCSQATYAQGSDISNLVAKAFMTVTPTADFAIQNGGGVRITVENGDHTIAEAYTLLPFSNTLVTMEMSGAQIVTVLEDALSNRLDDNGSTGSYPYASGIRFDVDASQIEGSRITNVEVNPRVAGEWVAIDLGATYTVVTNDFIAKGFDGYDTFGELWAMDAFVNTYTNYAQGWIDYAELVDPLVKLPPEEYSTQVYIGTEGCDHSQQADCEGF